MPKISSPIDRKTASRLLGVTVRTIDRYIRSGKLRANTQNGRIWLNKSNIMNLTKLHPVTVKTPVDRTVDTRKNDDNKFYRDLYETAQHAIHEYQQKLEQSNYRIGQLESQVISHPAMRMPEPKHDREGANFDFLRKDLADREKEILILKDLARREKTARIVLAVITYILLILQPVFWYLLR